MHMPILAVLGALILSPAVALAAEPVDARVIPAAATAKAKPAPAKSQSAKPHADRLKRCSAQADARGLQAHARKRFIGECMAKR